MNLLNDSVEFTTRMWEQLVAYQQVCVYEATAFGLFFSLGVLLGLGGICVGVANKDEDILLVGVALSVVFIFPTLFSLFGAYSCYYYPEITAMKELIKQF